MFLKLVQFFRDATTDAGGSPPIMAVADFETTIGDIRARRYTEDTVDELNAALVSLTSAYRALYDGHSTAITREREARDRATRLEADNLNLFNQVVHTPDTLADPTGEIAEPKPERKKVTNADALVKDPISQVKRPLAMHPNFKKTEQED